MSKVTLTDLTAGYGLQAAYNANNDALKAAFDNTVSRDGSLPNAMLADLDMNSRKILNVATGTSSGDAVNLAQLMDKAFSELDVGEVPVVASIGAMLALPTPSTGDTVIVTEEGRGGLFVYDATLSATDDSGVIIDGWVRRFTGPINVRWFGAVGDYDPNAMSGTDSSVAFQAAIDYALANHVPLYVDRGMYHITTTLNVDGTGSSFKGFRIIGDFTGNSAEQTAPPTNLFHRPVVFYSGDDALFNITQAGYFFNGFAAEGLGFAQPNQHANFRLGDCFRVTKDAPETYPRNFRVVDCFFTGWRSCYNPVYTHGSAVDGAAFIGPNIWERVHVRVCKSFMRMDSTAHNRVFINDSYLHDFTESCFNYVNGAWAYLHLRNVTVEGSQPAVIDASSTQLQHQLMLDNVAAEVCGNQSADGGWGFYKGRRGAAERDRITISVSNNGYQFIGMPVEFRLGKGAKINSAHLPVLVSGEGWLTDTPDKVHPVISNNASYGQSEVVTVGMTTAQIDNRVPTMIRPLPNTISNVYSGDGPELTQEDLPTGFLDDYVGVAGYLFRHGSTAGYDAVAPAAGYLYVSGALRTAGNGRLSNTGTSRQIVVSRGGSPLNTIQLDDHCFWQTAGEPIAYTIVVAAPQASDYISSGEILFRAGEWVWATTPTFLFSEASQSLSACGGAVKPVAVDSADIAISTAHTFVGPIVRGPYKAEVDVRVSNGSFVKYLVSGEVYRFVAPTRNVVELGKFETGGLTFTSVAGGNDGAAMNVQVSNGATGAVTARITTKILAP